MNAYTAAVLLLLLQQPAAVQAFSTSTLSTTALARARPSYKRPFTSISRCDVTMKAMSAPLPDSPFYLGQTRVRHLWDAVSAGELRKRDFTAAVARRMGNKLKNLTNAEEDAALSRTAAQQPLLELNADGTAPPLAAVMSPEAGIVTVDPSAAAAAARAAAAGVASANAVATAAAAATAATAAADVDAATAASIEAGWRAKGAGGAFLRGVGIWGFAIRILWQEARLRKITVSTVLQCL